MTLTYNVIRICNKVRVRGPHIFILDYVKNEGSMYLRDTLYT